MPASSRMNGQIWETQDRFITSGNTENQGKRPVASRFFGIFPIAH